MFVSMALLYPWATKEYLLWRMSLGQICYYLRVGSEMKYGKPEEDDGRLVTADKMTAKQMRKKRDELEQQFGDISNG